MQLKFQLSFSQFDNDEFLNISSYANTNNNNISVKTKSDLFNPLKDSIYISGSSKYLGEWNLNRSIEMKLVRTPIQLLPITNTNCNSSSSGCSGSDFEQSLSLSSCSLSSLSSCDNYADNSTTIEYEALVDVDNINDLFNNESLLYYKYFIGQKTIQNTDNFKQIFLKQIEYNFRELAKPQSLIDNPTGPFDKIEINDKWPLVIEKSSQQDTAATATTTPNAKLNRIDNGWLLEGENEFQFHFFNNPIQLWSQGVSNAKNLCVNIVPWIASSGLYELKDYAISQVDFDDNQIVSDKKTSFNAFNYPEVYTSFRIRTYENPINLLFQVNIHEIDENSKINEKYLATGYFKVNKSLIDNSLLEIDMSLLSSNQIVGSLKAEILLITSIKESCNYTLRKNYNYHFNRSCVPIGHRGMGKTFDAGTLPGINFVENTIESFREAYNRGAQMVEFDVVLTKDKIPIVYHDFVFCLNHNAQDSDKYLSIAVNQLTYDEVKRNRIYSHKILKSLTNRDDTDLPKGREFFTSKLMFPTLKEMCMQLDPKLGFNVEIKYPIDLEDGSHEVENHIKWLNRNEYVDVILKELIESCQDEQRCVIITTFDPNLCSMIRMKQNKFPVLFLTNGITNKWKPYKDFRCKNTQKSLSYARAEHLHGIVAHAEELTQNLHLINILFNHTTKSANFLAYSWGDDLNELDKRQLFSQSGINGIIYDRINESN